MWQTVLPTFIGTLVGALIGAIGSYYGTKRTLAVEIQARLDFKEVTERRLAGHEIRMDKMEDKVVFLDVCDNCKDLWMAKIDGYHIESEKGMKTLNDAISSNAFILKDIADALSNMDRNQAVVMDRLKIARQPK